MKLYATTTSEKGKKGGVGGNSVLTLELQRGNQVQFRLFYDGEGVIVKNETKGTEVELIAK